MVVWGATPLSNQCVKLSKKSEKLWVFGIRKSTKEGSNLLNFKNHRGLK